MMIFVIGAAGVVQVSILTTGIGSKLEVVAPVHWWVYFVRHNATSMVLRGLR